MPIEIDRNELERLLAAGAQLVDVLGRGEYAEDHLPGSVNVPLKELPVLAPRELDPRRPVVAYCHDYQ
jgi:rhodanese-related sulfurtransferase